MIRNYIRNTAEVLKKTFRFYEETARQMPRDGDGQEDGDDYVPCEFRR